MPPSRPHPRALTLVLLVAAVAAGACGGGGERYQPPRRPDNMRREDFLREFAAATRRKGRIRGWSDSQRLAVLDSAAPRAAAPNDTVAPPGLRYGPLARIVPVDDLDKIREADFDRWQTVAYVQSNGAYPKLGIPTPDTPFDPVAVEIRRARARDTVRWEMRMVYPPRRYVSQTFPVVREPHPSADGPFPYAARWVFDDRDEAVWVGCADGCCTGGSHAQ